MNISYTIQIRHCKLTQKIQNKQIDANKNGMIPNFIKEIKANGRQNVWNKI